MFHLSPSNRVFNSAPERLVYSFDNIIALDIYRKDTGEELHLRGREAWCMSQLIASGDRGITSLENPAPRMSHYIFLLRRRGLPVETTEEKHAGAYSGTHARYHLRCPVEVLDRRYAGQEAA